MLMLFKVEECVAENLLDKNDKPAVCNVCQNQILKSEGFGQSGFNHDIVYFCSRCADLIQPPPKND